MFPTHEHAHTERWPQRGRPTTTQAVGLARRSRIQVDILYSGTSPAGYNACAWTLAARESVGKRVFITDVKGTFLGMSESEEASKRR